MCPGRPEGSTYNSLPKAHRVSLTSGFLLSEFMLIFALPSYCKTNSSCLFYYEIDAFEYLTTYKIK